ncbi:hypothetical protein ACLBXM_18445 [Xanthobacteraceae bacterium A53D]
MGRLRLLWVAGLAGGFLLVASLMPPVERGIFGASHMVMRAVGEAGTLATALLSRAFGRFAVAGEGVVRDHLVLWGGAGEPALTAEVWSGALHPPAGRRLLLYTPGSGQPRTDNARTAVALARAGYVVVALDDVELAPETRAHWPALDFDFSSAEAYAETLARADRKVEAQARRLSVALDRLTTLAARRDAPEWLKGLDLQWAGAFGWSLGGASAAEASITDPRIRATANLDGWLFGAAARGEVRAPYLLILSDYPFPTAADLDAAQAAHRYQSRLTRRDLDEERRLIARPGSAGFRLVGGIHEMLSDRGFEPAFWRSWRQVDPAQAKRAMEGCLAGFFAHHLAGAAVRSEAPPDCASARLERLRPEEDW